jgi:hypothetical protein
MMPAIETDDLVDLAMVWTIFSKTNYSELVLNIPEEVYCRWEDEVGQPGQPLDEDQYGRATVAVGEPIAVGSLMFKGTRIEANTPGAKDIRIVVACKTVRDIKGRTTRRELQLVRYANTLPGVLTLP